MNQSRVVGAVEIGTSKVAVLVGEIIENVGLNIIGHSSCASRGVKKGTINNLLIASDCVHATIFDAEKKSNITIDEIYLAQTGSHLQGNFNLGAVTVSSASGVISQSDIDQAKNDARRRSLPENRTYIHHIQNPFIIDDHVIDNPLSRQADHLQVGYWSVHGDSQVVKDCLRVIYGIDLDVGDIIISSIASGEILLEDSEKENGALVIDMGGGTTDYVLYRNGYIVRTGVVAVGGDHITNDLSIGLRIGRKNAEEFKLKYGRAYYSNDDREDKVCNSSDLNSGDLVMGVREYPVSAITKIIEARVNEIFSIVKEQLEEAHFYDTKEIASGIVLTGGTSRLNGIEETAASVFGIPVRAGRARYNVSEEIRQPEFSTVLGLLHYALTGQEEAEKRMETRGLIRRVAKFFDF